ncbi:hypothetical protein D9M73_229330 [compost metagenome]
MQQRILGADTFTDTEQRLAVAVQGAEGFGGGGGDGRKRGWIGDDLDHGVTPMLWSRHLIAAKRKVAAVRGLADRGIGTQRTRGCPTHNRHKVKYGRCCAMRRTAKSDR